ncbi:39317_t:CDS:2 [Gigaspora margarita]|uniref:39317_t:CDS:1 n=1 Tax=Gigaspora margarita TaxID=4874 RepID=A0ABN7VL11_GIGMA|nr:39317_t:CDS:2 [Gigaspora margarita]
MGDNTSNSSSESSGDYSSSDVSSEVMGDIISDTLNDTLNKKTFVFDERKKPNKTIFKFMDFFDISQSIDVTLHYFDDIDTITGRVIDEYNLNVKLSDIRLVSSLAHESHRSSDDIRYLKSLEE